MSSDSASRYIHIEGTMLTEAHLHASRDPNGSVGELEDDETVDAGFRRACCPLTIQVSHDGSHWEDVTSPQDDFRTACDQAVLELDSYECVRILDREGQELIGRRVGSEEDAPGGP